MRKKKNCDGPLLKLNGVCEVPAEYSSNVQKTGGRVVARKDIYIAVSFRIVQILFRKGIVAFKSTQQVSPISMSIPEAGAIGTSEDVAILRLIIHGSELLDEDGKLTLTLSHLPISRISAVFCRGQSDAAAKNYAKALLAFTDTSYPEHLFYSCPATDSPCGQPLTEEGIITDDSVGRVFDQVLGGIASARNAGLYYSCYADDRFETPLTSYYSLLSKLINFDKSLRSGRLLLKSLIVCLLDQSDISENELDALVECLMIDADVIASDKGETIFSRLVGGLPQDAASQAKIIRAEVRSVFMPGIKEYTSSGLWSCALLATLEKDGVLTTLGFHTFKASVQKYWNNLSFLNAALYLLGARFGYSKLYAYDVEIYGIPEWARSVIANKKIPIKFSLESPWERMLIESVWRLSMDNGGKAIPQVLKAEFQKLDACKTLFESSVSCKVERIDGAGGGIPGFIQYRMGRVSDEESQLFELRRKFEMVRKERDALMAKNVMLERALRNVRDTVFCECNKTLNGR